MQLRLDRYPLPRPHSTHSVGQKVPTTLSVTYDILGLKSFKHYDRKTSLKSLLSHAVSGKEFFSLGSKFCVLIN